MSVQPIGKITYRQQRRTCGKATCKTCREGQGHGPYWYAFWHEKTASGRKMYSRYLGKNIPQQNAGNDDVESTGQSDV